MNTYFTDITIRRILLATWVCCIVGFSILTGLVIKDRLRNVDFAATVKLQDRISKRFDTTFVTLVDLGSMEIQTVLIVIVILIAPVSKKVKLFLAIGYIAGLAVTLMGKNFLPQPAPPFLLQRGTMGFSFPSSHVQVDASYPSGHTYRVVFLASLISGIFLIDPKRTLVHLSTAIGTLLFATLVMIGLVLLGKHWASDVGGGIFLALGLVSGILFLTHRSHNT